ncbi:MAG: 30S ribosome-binding factor RbfA [Bacteroidales bacterium]|nr:30S ribosome-binding factor RbfA [Bacteroidales bacterium]
METQRQKKIARLLQKDLGEIISNLVRDKMLNVMVTVTKVIPTSDLSIAKVYLSLFAVTDKQRTLQEIVRHDKEIRHQLGNRIRHQLRVVPELLFFEDDSLDYIEKIDSLLQQQ